MPCGSAGLPERVPQPERPAPSARRAPSRARRRTRSARRGPGRRRARSSGRSRTGSPRSRRRPRSPRRRRRAPAGPRCRPCTRSRSRRTAAPSRRPAGGRGTTCCRACPCAPPVTTRNSVAAEPHDRQVRLDPAGLVEQRRVDDPPDRHVHLGDGHPLDVVERARAADVEDRERGQVDHPDPVAHGQVLGVDDRRPPARFPLGRAGHDPVAVLLEQRLVRVVPERTLPAGRLEEDRAELALAGVERAEADVAVALPLLGRVDDAVGLVEALGRSRLDVGARRLVGVEAGDVGAVRVDLGLAVGHPLGDHPGDPGRLLDPDRGGRPEALDLGRLAQDRHPVRRQRQQAVDRVADADPLVAEDVRDELEGLLHLELEVVLGERQLGRRQRRTRRSTGCRPARRGSPGARTSRPRGRRRAGARTCSCPCRGRSGTRSRRPCRRTAAPARR